MHRFVLAFFLVAFGLAPQVALACPAYVPAEIKITRLFNEPIIDHTLDLQGISVVASNSHSRAISTNEVPMGLTESIQRTETSFQITGQPQPDGSICAQVSMLELRYGFPQTMVYIARDLPQGSCSYNEVLGHEQKHVAANQWLLDTYLPVFNSLMPQLAAQIGIARVSSMEEANSQFHETIDLYMKHLSANMTTVYNNRQHDIDTPSEYQHLSNVCNGAMARMVSMRRR